MYAVCREKKKKDKIKEKRKIKISGQSEALDITLRREGK